MLTVGPSGSDTPPAVPVVLPESGPAMLVAAVKFLAAKLHAEKELAQMYPELFGEGLGRAAQETP